MSKGILVVKSLSDRTPVSELEGKPTQTFMITRYLPKNFDIEKYNIKHLSDLAPTAEILKKVNEYKHNNIFTQDVFNTWFKPIYNKEIAQPSKQKALQEIINLLDSGINVVAMCTCGRSSQTLCHRVVVGEILERLGYKVIFR